MISPNYYLVFLVAATGLSVASSKTRSRNVTEFFPEINGNLSQVTWAHAVNTHELLEEALSSSVMMLEADVIIGKHGNDNSTNDEPIMGHPPETTSNLSLNEFLKSVLVHNQKPNSTKKGIKLDFKTIEAFEQSTELISSLYPKMDYPVWFNADILPGPVESIDEPVDPDKFISGAKQFVDGTLSIGWKTLFQQEGNYTLSHIQNMISLIKKHQITQPITFPVRLCFAVQSIDQLSTLVDEVENSTLTIWHFEQDGVDFTNLRQLICRVTTKRTYLDLPPNILDKLRLDCNAGGSLMRNVSLFTLVLALLALIV